MKTWWWTTAGTLAALGLVGCSSGGDSDPPTQPTPDAPVLLQFAAAEAVVPEGDAGSEAYEVDVRLSVLDGLLEEPVTVEVLLAGGTAANGDDFLPFAEGTLEFAAGSADEDRASVTITVLGDRFVEADETVSLQLSAASGAALGATSSTVVRILDDDSPASLEVSARREGGAVLALSPGETLDFGADEVGPPAGASYQVLFENGGDSGVDFSPVGLTGPDADEFSVEVEVSPLPDPVVLALPAANVPYAPLFAVDVDPQAGVQLVLDPAQLAELSRFRAFRLEGLQAPGAETLALDLERVPSAFGAAAELRVDGAPSADPLRSHLSESTVWRGAVAGRPGSSVFLGLSPYGVRGRIRLSEAPGDLLHLVSETSVETSPEGATARLVRPDQLAALGRTPPDSICADTRYAPGSDVSFEVPALKALTGEGTLTAAVCAVALETDFQLYQRFGSIPATVTFLDQLFAMVNEQYVEDVQTQISVAYVSLWQGPFDPWTAQDGPTCSAANPCAGALLGQFREAWAPTFGAELAPKLEYDVATFLSGASIGGGIAYVDVLCEPNFNFGVAGDMNEESPLDWDFLVVAHEIGHAFGASHTHDYCPPIDRCQPPGPDQACDFTQECGPGTIMSYCHLCNGGQTQNVALQFHPQISAIMRSRVDVSCLGLPAGTTLGLRVTYDPQSAGEHAAELQLGHDVSGVPSPWTVGLRGETP